MKTSLGWRLIASTVVVAIYASLEVHANGVRVKQEIRSNETIALHGSVDPRAALRLEAGREDSSMSLRGVTMYVQFTSQQKADLDELVRQQLTPGSAQYHHWLTSAEFADRFGLSDEDLSAIENWLERQGFTIDRVAKSHTAITFSGTVGQIESAFGTEMHKYRIHGNDHYANSSEIRIPSALAGVVGSVRNLNDFRPRSHAQFHRERVTSLTPSFTSSQSGNHYMTPKDVATIYDVNAAYSAGYTGEGQSIAIVGQSEVSLADIENFQSAAGLSKKDPTLVLVPSSGAAAVSSGDEAESDLDLEYSSGMATGAGIYFVYVGDNSNYSVFDALQYAVDTRIAPIISMSYGACETEYSSTDYSTLESILEQASSQGQSVVVASGDDGSTSCYGTTSLSTSQQEALIVDYPASSAYATGLGGTEFPSSDVSSSNTTYWQSADGSDVIGSALKYIPEQVWNDDSSSNGLGSGGGGISSLTARPSWQTDVSGIPSGSYRLVPDISLDSSPNNAGYLYCTSDTSSWSSSQQASCNSGFRDSSTQYLTVAGGTSFAAPIFAGMLAIINQKVNSTGEGLINSTLYSLAANSSTYSSAFHDITAGSNECTAGSSYCSSSGASEYSAGTGYDEASGLGSIDLFNLMASWPTGSASSLQATVTTATAASSAPSSGASDVITIVVAAQSSSVSTSPTGTLTIEVDGTTASSSVSLSGGSGTYAFSSSTAGSHVVAVTYSGDSTFAPSTGSVTLTVGGSSSGSSSGTFALSATSMTIAQGNSGSATVTVTSQNSYAGTVSFSLSTGSSSFSAFGCYDISNATVSAGGTASSTLTIYTSSAACSSSSSSKSVKRRRFSQSSLDHGVKLAVGSRAGTGPLMSMLMFSSLVAAGFQARRRRWVWSACCLVGMALALSTGCSSSSTSSAVAKGTYTLTLDGSDTSNSSITASTSVTVTVD